VLAEVYPRPLPGVHWDEFQLAKTIDGFRILRSMRAGRTAWSPCLAQADALREAIKAWVEASEATRAFMVRMPVDLGAALAPFHPGYFNEMQAAYERERAAREQYILANNALYDCMETNGLIP